MMVDDEDLTTSTLSQRLRRAVSPFVDSADIMCLGTAYNNNNNSNSSNSGNSNNSGSGSGRPANALLSQEILRKYIDYSRRYCHPRLTKAAAKVLQRLYLTMRAQSALGTSIPVTTRHLESLIRLSQARARMELREEVTEADANDVVQLLHESLLDAFTTDTGEIDFGRKGGMSLVKQVKGLVATLNREATIRGTDMFSRGDISEICVRMKLVKDVDSLIDVLRTECYLLLKGPKLYQLQTA